MILNYIGSPMVLLSVNNITKNGPGDFRLHNISFTQNKREKIVIAGESGAGKSTLLKLIAGLLQPDGGEVLFEKKNVEGPDDQLVPGHAGIAFLSQHFELQKSLRVEQVLEYSNRLSDREAHRLYRVCQIDHLLKRRTDELSGGERQRVAICRLLISRPRLLLLDEPYSHLDIVHKNTLKDVIRDIGDKLRITCMLVSHDPQDTLSWADKIIVMKDGRIVQTGTPEEIYNRPVNEYTGGLFGKYNIIKPEYAGVISRLPSVKRMMATNGANVFVRPEQFKLLKKSDTALRAKVGKVRFYGTFSEAEVLVSGKILTVRTSLPGIAEGQTIYVTIPRGPLWSV